METYRRHPKAVQLPTPEHERHFADLSLSAIERINRLNEHFQKFFSIWNFFPQKSGNFRKSVKAFHAATTSFHRKKIFIDGTKDINRCLCIKHIVSDRIRVIHLIRDPRAYITSLRRNFPKIENHSTLGSEMWKGPRNSLKILYRS